MAEISETVCYIPLLGYSAVVGPCLKVRSLEFIPSTLGMWRRDRSAFIREHGLPNAPSCLWPQRYCARHE